MGRLLNLVVPVEIYKNLHQLQSTWRHNNPIPNFLLYAFKVTFSSHFRLVCSFSNVLYPSQFFASVLLHESGNFGRVVHSTKANAFLVFLSSLHDGVFLLVLDDDDDESKATLFITKCGRQPASYYLSFIKKNFTDTRLHNSKLFTTPNEALGVSVWSFKLARRTFYTFLPDKWGTLPTWLLEMHWNWSMSYRARSMPTSLIYWPILSLIIESESQVRLRDFKRQSCEMHLTVGVGIRLVVIPVLV